VLVYVVCVQSSVWIGVNLATRCLKTTGHKGRLSSAATTAVGEEKGPNTTASSVMGVGVASFES
jgi:hypothetical protein